MATGKLTLPEQSNLFCNRHNPELETNALKTGCIYYCFIAPKGEQATRLALLAKRGRENQAETTILESPSPVCLFLLRIDVLDSTNITGKRQAKEEKLQCLIQKDKLSTRHLGKASAPLTEQWKRNHIRVTLKHHRGHGDETDTRQQNMEEMFTALSCACSPCGSGRSCFSA
ncbi:protein DENND6B [Platysternon megacephalum]|uniref:Protein DENND6B n=1 Tax=Platysternon megacephalum TaxID=55544 RepID=A0A4D9E250_9SAUR|nr:protein DENND6B [Platysternon megacephalum]